MSRVSWALVGFSLFLVGVVYAADVGIGKEYFDRVRAYRAGDKICHFAFMGILSTLANLTSRCRPVSSGRSWLLRGTSLVALIVLAEEISQIWIPGRNFDWKDLSADALGIAAGDWLARRITGSAPAPQEAR